MTAPSNFENAVDALVIKQFVENESIDHVYDVIKK